MPHKTQLFICMLYMYIYICICMHYSAQKIEILIDYVEIENVLEQYSNLENMFLVVLIGSTILVLFM